MRGLLISIRLVFINGFQSSLLYVGKYWKIIDIEKFWYDSFQFLQNWKELDNFVSVLKI